MRTDSAPADLAGLDGTPGLSPFIEGRFGLAAAAVRSALASRPSDAGLHYLAGLIHSCSCEHFDPNSVIDHLEQALAADPDLTMARPRLAQAYAMKGMLDWSLSLAEQRRAHHPDLAEAIAEVGRARIARGEYGDGIEAADEVVRWGGDVFAHGLAPAFILTGHHEQVVSFYDPEMESTNTRAANALTHLHAGINDVWLGRFTQAEQHFERGAEFVDAPWQAPQKALFHLLLGRAYGVRGRGEEARAALEAALQAVGRQPVLEYALGVEDLAAGRPEGAREASRRLEPERHRAGPGWNEPWRRLLLGEIALAGSETTRAVDELREAWSLQRPLSIDCVAGNADAYFLDALGRAYLASGRPKDALSMFEQIRSLGDRALNQPEIAVLALYGSGVALHELGRSSEAVARLGQFVRLWGKADAAPRRIADARDRLEHLGAAP